MFKEVCLQLIRFFGIFVFTSKSALYTAFVLLFLCNERKWCPPRKIRQKIKNQQLKEQAYGETCF